MTPQEKKVAHYRRQLEYQNRISLWLAVAIVAIPIFGLGVFFTVTNGSANRAAPATAHALRFGASQDAPKAAPAATETASKISR
jgi:hypothetical protein